MATISVPGRELQAWQMREVAPASLGGVQVALARSRGREEERIVVHFAHEEWERIAAPPSTATGARRTTPGSTIRQLRELLGLSQGQLARKLGTNSATVSRWERDAKQPPPYLTGLLLEWIGKDTQKARGKRQTTTMADARATRSGVGVNVR